MTEAAKRGWAPISATSSCPNGSRRTGLATSRAATRSARTADPADWRVAKSIFVADDEATAQRYGKSDEGPYHFYFTQLLRKLVGGRPLRTFKLDPSEPDDASTPDA